MTSFIKKIFENDNKSKLTSTKISNSEVFVQESFLERYQKQNQNEIQAGFQSRTALSTLAIKGQTFNIEPCRTNPQQKNQENGFVSIFTSPPFRLNEIQRLSLKHTTSDADFDPNYEFDVPTYPDSIATFNSVDE